MPRCGAVARRVETMTGESRTEEGARRAAPGRTHEDEAGGGARLGRRSAAWALAYLRGRAVAFNRGSVTRANVEGGVKLALRYGASLEEVQQVLAEYQLMWDVAKDCVARPERSGAPPS
jgi:hypothetical protein